MSAEERITLEETRKVARLARLRFDEPELAEMRDALAPILEYVAALSALDVTDVPPTTHAIPMDAPLRPDVPHDPLPRHEALRAAPASEDGAFVVPKVMDGG